MTVQCCKCQKIRVAGRWMSNEGLLRGDISHGYCPVCLEETLEEFHGMSQAHSHDGRAVTQTAPQLPVADIA